MALAFVRVASGAASPAATPLNISIDGTATNGLMIAHVQCQDNTVSSVTFDGASFTKIVEDAENSTVGQWALKNPSATTTNVVVNYTGTKFVKVIVDLYSGFEGLLSEVVTASVNGTSLETSKALAVIPTIDNSWVIGTGYANAAIAITATGATQTASVVAGVALQGMYTGPVTPPASTSQTSNYNVNSGSEWIELRAAYGPTVGATGLGWGYGNTGLW